ncbi:MAG: AraC family transcriptional regulator [Clostridium sp.]|nr:AraC family transcriptional regulator [Clostridium sp.]
MKQWEEERKTEKRAGAEGNLLASQVQQLIWERRGAVKIKDLERETFYSARRLQEVIVQQIGIAPKQLCRQTRFQHALRDALSMQKLCMAQEAYGLGYCDQAHYSREFKEFMGICPRKILAESEKV